MLHGYHWVHRKLAIHSKRSVHPFNMCVGRPMDRINIDTIGPFPQDEEGNKYIMVFIDVFSRFVELVPVPDLTASTAAKEVIKFTGRYGIPDEILTDNGTQYLNELSSLLYDFMCTNHMTILSYSLWRCYYYRLIIYFAQGSFTTQGRLRRSNASTVSILS